MIERYTTKLFKSLSEWMQSCVDMNMSLKEFSEIFSKFIKEREEGLENETKKQ